MLKAVEAYWNDKWTIEQVKWVERQYKTLSSITRERKQELTGIPNFNSASNLGPNTANSRGLSVEPQTQWFQDIRFQTLPQQPPKQAAPPRFSEQTPHLSQPQFSQQPFVLQDLYDQQNFCNQQEVNDRRSIQYSRMLLQ